MRRLIILLIIGWHASLSNAATTISDERTTKRDGFWNQLWLKEREPVLRRSQKASSRGAGELNWQYESRSEIDHQSARMLLEMERQHQFLFDPYLDDYLTQLLRKVVGPSPIAGRPGTLNIRILKSSEANALALDDGTILIHSGILSLIRSEPELLGVLAHEVAHVVLDHNLQNYTSAKSAEAFANFMGVVGAVAGTVIASKSSERLSAPEIAAVGAGSGIIVSALTRTALDIIGASYSRSQEEEADLAAVQFLKAVGLNQEEYGDLLLRLGLHNKAQGISQSASLFDSHPSILSRLEEIEYTKTEPAQKSDLNYDRSVVECLSYSAALDIRENKYEEAAKILDRAIQSGWATEESYFLKAVALRHLSYDPQSSKDALAMLDIATQRKATDLRWTNSERGLLYLRLGDIVKALNGFEAYLADLSKLDPVTVQEEVVWAKKMIAKCKLMK